MPESRSLRQVLADNMKVLRAQENISQEDFAALCDLHRTYISDIERCNRNISIDNIEKIAAAFHITASELLKEDYHVNCKRIHFTTRS